MAVKLRPIIGIDISAEEVRAALVRPQGGLVQLAAVTSVELPEGSMQPDGLPNAAVVGDAIRRACQQLDPKVSRVVVGISHGSLVARVMEIPPVPDSDVRAVLRGEMDHYRILPAGQSAFDCFRLPDLPEGDGPQPEEPTMRALLMGAEERLVTGYRAAVDAAGLGTIAVEPGAIAALRALYPAIRQEESVATVFMSATGTDIFITHAGDLRFYRRVDTGTADLRNAAPAAAQAQHAPSAPLVAADDDIYVYQQPQSAGPADAFNRQAMGILMTEVQRSLDYYLREYPQGRDSMRIRLVIDTPDAAEIADAVKPFLRGEPELANVCGVVPALPILERMLDGAQGARFAVAIGLALRGAPAEFAGAPALDLSVGDMVVVERRVAPKLMLATAAFCGVVFLGTITTAIFLGSSISRADLRLTQSKAELKALSEEHATRVAALERQKNLVAAIRARDKPVKEVIDYLAASISRRACLTTLALENNGTIYLGGEATSPRVVADLMDTVNLSPMLTPIRLNALARFSDATGISGLKFELETSILPMPILDIGAMTASAATKPAGSASAPNAKPQGGT